LVFNYRLIDWAVVLRMKSNRRMSCIHIVLLASFVAALHARYSVASEPVLDANSDPAAVVSPAEMRSVYDEVKTPFKYGIVLRPGEHESIDCPSVFRFDDKWYMVYIAIKGKIGYETLLAQSNDLVTWKTLGKILPFAQSGWDRWNRSYLPRRCCSSGVSSKQGSNRAEPVPGRLRQSARYSCCRCHHTLPMRKDEPTDCCHYNRPKQLRNRPEPSRLGRSSPHRPSRHRLHLDRTSAWSCTPCRRHPRRRHRRQTIFRRGKAGSHPGCWHRLSAPGMNRALRATMRDRRR